MANGKVYGIPAVDETSLKTIIQFGHQAAEIGLPYTWGDVERIFDELDPENKKVDVNDLSPEQVNDALMLTGVMVWLCRRAAGEDVSLGEAIDFPASSIDYLDDTVKKPQDRKKPAKKAAKKTAQTARKR